MSKSFCKCGESVHPLYGEQCEDCWIEAQPCSNLSSKYAAEYIAFAKKLARRSKLNEQSGAIGFTQNPDTKADN